MIFEVDPEQVSRLDSIGLVQLMRRLLVAECRLAEIPLRATSVPLQITIPDGGEDGRVEWTGGVGSTEYFPSRFSIFQSKAQNLTDSSVRAEILKKQSKGRKKPKGKKVGKDKGELKEAIVELLSRGGAYVVFCSHAFVKTKIEKLRRAIETAIRDTASNLPKAAAIEIYDANRISDWVNSHPSVALWLTSRERRRSLAGFQPHESWGRSEEIASVPWVSDATSRFIPENIPQEGRVNGEKIAWTFEQASEAMLKHLTEDRRILRIAGPSGFGKSRVVYEIFNRRRNTADEADAGAVVYADYSIVGDEVLKLALEISDAGSPTILVVDECVDEDHVKLAEIARRTGSRLRLVTIDVETRVVQAEGTLTVRLERAPDQMIGLIARAIRPKLEDSSARLIEELSAGFPRMAVLAARQEGNARQTIKTADQVVDRIVWGKRSRRDEAQKVLEFLSLFEWLGQSGHVSDQTKYVAAELAGIPEDAFIEHVTSFESRGIIVRRGDFVQVQPIPLAVRLAAHRLAVLPEGKLNSFFTHAPSHLQIRLLDRLRWLDTSNSARKLACQILKPDGLGNLAALNTDHGAKCLDRLVHVDPDAVMATIDRVFGDLSRDELSNHASGRRHLVWALEKLVFRKATFHRAARLLRRLAVAETEERIGNNATGQFKGLFQLYLSGTEADPETRLFVLDEGLQSEDPREREVCIEALGTMLQTDDFLRTGGSNEIGSGPQLRDWSPKNYGEIWDFYRASIRRLTGIAVNNDPLSERARLLLSAHIRGLLHKMPFEDLKAMIDQIVLKRRFWPEVIQALNQWLYFDRKHALPEFAKQVRSYFDDLMPTDVVDLAVLYTLGGLGDFNDPDIDYNQSDSAANDFEYANRKSCEFVALIAADSERVDRTLDRLVTSEANGVFSFARRLAELVADPRAVFESATLKAEAKGLPINVQFFSGLISGIDSRAPHLAADCIRRVLQSSRLKDHAISMISSRKLQPEDLRLVASLLQTGDVEPAHCAPLSYGRGLEHMTAEEIEPLLDELPRHGGKGLWTAVEIISMYLHSGRVPAKALLKKLKTLMLAPALFDVTSARPGDGHHLQEMTKLLAESKAIDAKFAKSLAKQILTICQRRKSDVFHVFRTPARAVLTRLMGLHPTEVWSAISNLALSKDPLIRYYVQHLVEVDDDNHLGAGLLCDLPADLYLAWVRKAPEKRARFVMKWLPIVQKANDGSLLWHSAFVAFVNEFGQHKFVLPEASVRMLPSSYFGSIAPHIAPLVPLLKSWSSHPKSEIRLWASDTISSLRAYIGDEEKHEAERSAGLF